MYKIEIFKRYVDSQKQSNQLELEATDDGEENQDNITQFSKIGKKCNFKSTKIQFLLFQKWQKINFCIRKKFKITKNAILNFFLVQKLIFCHF